MGIPPGRSKLQQVHSEPVEHVNFKPLVPAELLLPRPAEAALPGVELDPPAFLEREAHAAEEALLVKLPDVAVPRREHDCRSRWRVVRRRHRLVQLQLQQLVDTLLAIALTRRRGRVRNVVRVVRVAVALGRIPAVAAGASDGRRLAVVALHERRLALAVLAVVHGVLRARVICAAAAGVLPVRAVAFV